jgi:alpha-glucuronidase
MMGSREALVNYETPLGLSHLVDRGHYNPFPGTNHEAPEVNSYYYHRSDTLGIGVDRTNTGSKAVNCYQPGERDRLADLKTCPENLLLWFHHVPWDYSMASGHTLWDELCFHYESGVDWVKQTQKTWSELSGKIDADQYQLVAQKLDIQEKDAVHWRNVCLTFFQTFSKRPYPSSLQVKPETVP